MLTVSHKDHMLSLKADYTVPAVMQMTSDIALL